MNDNLKISDLCFDAKITIPLLCLEWVVGHVVFFVFFKSEHELPFLQATLVTFALLQFDHDKHKNTFNKICASLFFQIAFSSLFNGIALCLNIETSKAICFDVFVAFAVWLVILTLCINQTEKKSTILTSIY